MLDHPARFPRTPPRSYIRGGEFRGFGKPENPVFGVFGEFRGKFMSTSTCPECGDRFEKDASWKKTCMPCWKASKRPERRQPDALLTSKQETAVAAWLAQIGESDETIIDDVLTVCRQDDDLRAYYLGRAAADSAGTLGGGSCGMVVDRAIWRACGPLPGHPAELSGAIQ